VRLVRWIGVKCIVVRLVSGEALKWITVNWIVDCGLWMVVIW
jgi:hypothetical protein